MRYSRIPFAPIISGVLFVAVTVFAAYWFMSTKLDSDDYTPFIPKISIKVFKETVNSKQKEIDTATEASYIGKPNEKNTKTSMVNSSKTATKPSGGKTLYSESDYIPNAGPKNENPSSVSNETDSSGKSTEIVDSSGNTENKGSAEIDVNAGNTGSSNTDNNQSTDATKTNWVDEKVEKYKDEINDTDLKDFKSIFSKIDMDHVNQLFADTSSEDGGLKVRQYLLSILTADEYTKAKQLFGQYNELIYK